MANLDSRLKRASSVGLMLVSILAPPLPDGALTAAGDRQHIAWSYGGIEATSPPTTPITVRLRGEVLRVGSHARDTLAVPFFVRDALSIPVHPPETLRC